MQYQSVHEEDKIDKCDNYHLFCASHCFVTKDKKHSLLLTDCLDG